MQLPFGYDLERIVDDFVFMCFFVGNDFLPHMPTLEIREGAIELLVSLYKRILPSLGGYLTDNGEVNGDRTKVLVGELSHLETGILTRRREKEQREQRQRAERETREREQRERRNNHNNNRGGNNNNNNNNNNNPNNPNAPPKVVSAKRAREDDDTGNTPSSKRVESDNRTPRTPNNPSNPSAPNTPGAATNPEDEDKVQLGTPGYRERYYHMKFHSELTDNDAISAICCAYIEGLAWVLRYYYQGCCSWKWYYPYHYAPFATDIARYLGEFKPTFALGEPFKPFEQLMGVLPPASCKCVPKPYHYVMGVKGEEKESPIKHLYPTDFKLDKNGKRMLWQAVVLLPFMDEKDLLKALSGLDKQLTPAERNRNTLGEDLLFVNTHHALAPDLVLAQELKEGKFHHLF